MIRFLYRAHLGLLEILGLLFRFIINRMTDRALNKLFKVRIPTPEDIRKFSKTQTFGFGEDDISELYTLPSIYASFKLV